MSKFNEKPLLDAIPANDDTALVYDDSAGVVKQVTTLNLSKKLAGRTVFVQDTEPSAGESIVGDIWIETTV